MKRPLPYVLAWLVAAGLAYGCGAEQPGVDPFGGEAPVPSGPTGSIRGVVRLQGDPPAIEFEPIEENQHICGDQALLPRITVGDGNGVQDAFVYLEGGALAEGIRYSRQSNAAEPVLVDQRECEYVPHALVVPVGTEIEVTNSDSILHNVHGREPTPDGLRTLFNIAQPVQGQRTTVNSPLTEPGIIYLSCEAGHPWMSAHILVTEHPYATLTDEAGSFVIDNVPVGTYQITMWHEGVRIQRILRSLQRYEYEEPYEITEEVTVEPGIETVVEFDMALRPES